MAQWKDALFVPNKYTAWYYKIIENANRQDRKKGNGVYYERHHIIPNSLIKNKETVLLSAKEHFVCHLLLTKMVINYSHRIKMINALIYLCGGNSHQSRYTSRSFELVRILVAEKNRYTHTGVKFSEERKLKISQSRLGSVVSEETREKIRRRHKGRTYEEIHGPEKAKELREKRRLARLGDKNPLFNKEPWNKGLDKYSNEILKQSGITQSKTKMEKKNGNLGK